MTLDAGDWLYEQAGVAAIGLGVMEKYDVSVPIVPVGLNYFRGHRFRGRVVVEFGQPIHITKELFQQYKHSKRGAIQSLLQQVMLFLHLPTPTRSVLSLIVCVLHVLASCPFLLMLVRSARWRRA